MSVETTKLHGLAVFVNNAWQQKKNHEITWIKGFARFDIIQSSG